MAQLQIPNSLDPKICLIGSFIEVKSYKSTLFFAIGKRKPICQILASAKKNNVSPSTTRGLYYPHCDLDRCQMMASLLKMGNDAEKSENH